MKNKALPPEYKLLDSGSGRKLEQVGNYRVIRPALNAFWQPTLPPAEWNRADAEFKRESGGGGGIWNWKQKNQPQEWAVTWGGIPLLIKPTHFGHLGFFAEQAVNWEWLRNCIRKMGQRPRTLNLFAYSGGATLAMAQAGADTCHLDASAGIIEWAKKNQALGPQTPGNVRWICDDAMKFVAREYRRHSRYNGIVLDPPSFGRGSQGQVWKIEEGIRSMLENCRAILDTDHPYFILLSCHSQGFSPISLGRCLAEVFPEAASLLESGEMTIPETGSGRSLPAGIYARIFDPKS